ncbi:MAG: integrase [Candidatus Entotheonella gemina]|uniref:Integrase n=1 Tax=Candidatus Entotheonella gemina TaxID=1429439 RepID=W4LEA1_9BACT|nr:MAG: integrase [Candidatus Entotheonella gemina]
MRCVITDQIVLSQAPEGPLSVYVGPFAELLSAQGYALKSIHRQVHLAACFSQWLQQQGVALPHITTDHANQYLRDRTQKVKPRSGDAAALQHVMGFLQSEGVLPAETVSVRRLTPAEHWTQQYEHHLREVRGLAETTIINYVPFIDRFLKDRFADGPVALSCLCARDVVSFVQRQVPRLHRQRAKLMTTALRSFLQYAQYRGDVGLELAAAVPVVPNWSMSSIPRAISADQVAQLLASIDQGTARGRRDYAILLLLARLGLRSSEVVGLELDDIDWNRAILTVRGKGAQRHEFPLSPEVGQAIAAYLYEGRPRNVSRRLFLRAKAPIRGFRSASGVGSIVRHALQCAGIEAPTYGAHQFRHGLATELLRQGASLSEIGDVLGHRHPQTTMIYTKVDLEALRTLALPWPGGAQ